MPKRLGRLSLWFLLALAPLILAMGVGESEGPVRIPEPQTDFRVLLTDQEGATVELTNFSIEGQSFVLGNMGKGEAAVPFDQVKEVELTNQGDKLKAKIILKKGPPVEVMVKPSLKATGKTSFGNYRISLGEVSRVKVLGRVK